MVHEVSRTVAGGQTVWDAVIQASAEYKNCSPDELPPLGYTINVDSLERLFSVHHKDTSADTIQFEYSNLIVTISQQDVIVCTVKPVQDGSAGTECSC